MAVTYLAWDGEEFSTPWWWVLRAAVADGVIKITDINDGHRSMALQAQRVREHGVWSPSNPNGAARPSPDAPHIWEGRPNHALDVQAPGPIARLRSWLRRNGVESETPIAAEPWHLVVDAGPLVALAERCRERLREPRYSNRERKLLAGRRSRANRAALKAQARLVQAAARRPLRAGGGWDRHDRARRFQGLRKAALS